jgi:hypothetical protein
VPIPWLLQAGCATAELFLTSFHASPSRRALNKLCQAVPGCRRVAVRRTAEFFLASFQERLAEQKRERARNKEYEKTFKAQTVTKEDQKARRKQILSSIGAWPCHLFHFLLLFFTSFLFLAVCDQERGAGRIWPPLVVSLGSQWCMSLRLCERVGTLSLAWACGFP